MLASSPVELEKALKSPPAQLAVIEPPGAAPQAGALRVRWRLSTRVAFRFVFLYFSLYVFFTQMLSSLLQVPNRELPDLGSTEAMQPVLNWVGAHILRLSQPIPFHPSGSGDKLADYVLSLTLVLAAFIVTIVWSVVDRKRDNYIALNKWFRVFLRLSLAATMVTYGTLKAIPVQMPFPSLTRLLEPYGDFSPMGVLWYSIGASRPYEIFAGCRELTAAILLFVPRLGTLGALVALADSIQIFTLNMTYDVPVKLFSFHLILISLVLIAPEAPRLAKVLVLDRTAEPSKQPPLFRGRRGNIAATALQIVFGAYIVGVGFYGSWQGWMQYGGGAPKSALYGIWNVEEMSVDGVIRAPLVNDYGRWRRLVFQLPAVMDFQRMDSTLARHGAAIDTNAKTLVLTKPNDKSWNAIFSYQQPDPTRLVLEGRMDGHKVRMDTRFVDPQSFRLVKTGFHWIQEFPFNR